MSLNLIPVMIAGVGYGVPETVITNDDLTKLVDTSDEWITTRTGIKERRVVSGEENAVTLGIKAAQNALEKAKMKAEDIDYLIPHQANIRIIQAVQERLGYSDDKVVTNIKYYGNTSAASIPIALAESVEKGKVKLGSTAVLCGFGAGMTWGGAIVRLREGIC